MDQTITPGHAFNANYGIYYVPVSVSKVSPGKLRSHIFGRLQLLWCAKKAIYSIYTVTKAAKWLCFEIKSGPPADTQNCSHGPFFCFLLSSLTP